MFELYRFQNAKPQFCHKIYSFQAQSVQQYIKNLSYKNVIAKKRVAKDFRKKKKKKKKRETLKEKKRCDCKRRLMARRKCTN